MKIHVFLLFLLLSLLTFPPMGYAESFGLKMGMSADDMNFPIEQISPGLFVTRDVPNPNTDFTHYVLKIDPEVGLCVVRAVGKRISTNSYGDDLTLAFDKMKKN